MHKPEFVLESETDKILWDFEIQTDHLIPTKRPDLVIIKNKRTCRRVDFCCFSGLQNENKRKRKDRQVLGPLSEN